MQIPATATDLGELTIVREFDAPREDVFAAYVTPERFVTFWGPFGMTVPLESVVIEPWAGGRFESTMVNQETGEQYPLPGVFIEVTEPSLISFTIPGSGMVNSIHLTDLGNGRTGVRLHQTGLPEQFRSPEAVAGLNSSLDRLAEHLAG